MLSAESGRTPFISEDSVFTALLVLKRIKGMILPCWVMKCLQAYNKAQRGTKHSTEMTFKVILISWEMCWKITMKFNRDNYKVFHTGTKNQVHRYKIGIFIDNHCEKGLGIVVDCNQYGVSCTPALSIRLFNIFVKLLGVMYHQYLSKCLEYVSTIWWGYTIVYQPSDQARYVVEVLSNPWKLWELNWLK